MPIDYVIFYAWLHFLVFFDVFVTSGHKKSLLCYFLFYHRRVFFYFLFLMELCAYENAVVFCVKLSVGFEPAGS